MKKTAIIIGVNGQDGKILFDLLLKKNYNLLGIDKNSVRVEGVKWRTKISITSPKQIFSLIKKIKPDEVYHLAAFHNSSQDKNQDNLLSLSKSFKINFFSLAYFLEAIKQYSPKTKIFYAASSLIFGNSACGLQNEKSLFNPDSFYGFSKLDGVLLCRFYRINYGLFASTGIFFNHESEYRKKNFVSRKIIQAVIDIKNKKQKKLEIGNLDAEVDWGYAPDYMEASHRIIALTAADDFVVATGIKHSVRDFVTQAFGYFNLDWKEYVILDKKLLTRKKSVVLGDAGKLTRTTGWKPSVNFNEMIVKIIKQLDR